MRPNSSLRAAKTCNAHGPQIDPLPDGRTHSLFQYPGGVRKLERRLTLSSNTSRRERERPSGSRREATPSLAPTGHLASTSRRLGLVCCALRSREARARWVVSRTRRRHFIVQTASGTGALQYSFSEDGALAFADARIAQYLRGSRPLVWVTNRLPSGETTAGQPAGEVPLLDRTCRPTESFSPWKVGAQTSRCSNDV